MPFRIRLTLALLLAGFLAALILPLILPIPPLENTVPEAQLADAESRFVEVDGLTVHYKEAGEGGFDLLLLHGFGSSLFSWRETLGPLAAFGRVVAFDQPGFGFTERPERWQGVNPYSPEGGVALTVELMDALEMERAVLVGSSAGGTLAVRLALAHPDRLEALILVDPALVSGGGAPAWARPLLGTPQFERIGPLIMRQFEGETGEAFFRSAWSDPERLSDETLSGYRRLFLVEGWDRALWQVTRASREADPTDSLPRLTVPTLVIAGAEDAVVPPEESERAAALIPGAEFVTLPGCGHLPQEECPAAFLAALEGFLQGLPTEKP